MHSGERECERATPRSTLQTSGGQSRPAQRTELLRTSQSAGRLAPPKFVPREAQAFSYAQTQRNGRDLDLERTNKRGAHAHNIRTRKGFAQGPARELAGEYGGDAKREAEGLQRGAEGAVADEYETWTRRPKSAAPAYEAIPVSQPRSMARTLDSHKIGKETHQPQSRPAAHRCAAATTGLFRSNPSWAERASLLWTRAEDEEVVARSCDPMIVVG
ncbi:hypothetical protein K438DRAFT_1785128 [Mycena galopus ATCC 62051]|nr:hypothetical protein K438DRAFT_1785128 [Mycena galopus ATCC 62051]